MKFLVALALFAGIVGAQSTIPLTGVWRITEASTPKQVLNTQGGIYIFTGKYFSKLWDRSETPRRDLNKDSTDTERLAAFRPLMSKAGTYEVSGTRLTTHTLVANNPTTMHPGNSDIYSFKLEGNTLWITDVNEGGQPSTNPVTLKFTRVE
jgi:hypothetical protein